MGLIKKSKENNRKIALIGFGTIASDVLQGLKTNHDLSATEWAVLLRAGSARRNLVPDAVHLVNTVEELINWQPDLVIEAASQDVVKASIVNILKNGISVVVTSVGALAEPAIYKAAIAAAQQGGCQLIIPAGAVASLDYLGALGDISPASVVYESRKPIAAWRDELSAIGLNPDTLDHEVELFSGSAQEAATRYPKNLNVAATLALAGVGMERTQVRVVCDPKVSGNQHKISVDSPLGTLVTTQLNSPSKSNPKTSWLVAQSVIHTVKRQFATVLVG